MIRLNLLPPDSKGRRAQRGWSGGGSASASSGSGKVWLAIIPAFLVAIAVFAYVYYTDVYQPQQVRDAKRTELNDLRATVADLESQFSGLREAAARFEQQSNVIDILMPANRILWSEKFNQISQCLPENVFLTHLVVDETVREIPTPESLAAHDAWLATPADQRGDEPQLVMVPSIIQSLSIEGITYSEERERRIQLVLDFRQNLMTHRGTNAVGDPRSFMQHFAGIPYIEYNETRDIAGVEINAFRMVIDTVDLANLASTT